MKRYKTYMLSLIILLAANSCIDDKFFDLTNPPESPWITLSEFDRAPVGLYSNLFVGHEWDNPYVNIIIPKISSGDDVDWVSYEEPGYLRKTKEYQRYNTTAWPELYKVIGGANDALGFVDRNGGNPYPDASESDITNNLNRIVGELHFLRGFCYYLLQTTFGHAYVPGGANSTPDIPLRTTYPTDATDAKNPKIGTTKEVFAQIIADLSKAKELLPEKYDPATMPVSYQERATKFAASAMLMRAYFQRGDYDSARMECDYIIDQNGGQFDLSEDPIEAWNKSSATRGREVIFYIPLYDLSAGGGNNHLTFFNAFDPAPPKTSGELHMGKSTIKRLGWMDNPQTLDTVIKFNARVDKRFTQLFSVRYPKKIAKPDQTTDGQNREQIVNRSTIWCYKYWRGPLVKWTNVPIIRLAEVYLTRSIIRFRAGDLAGAADDLNVVRKRAWNTDVGGPYVDIKSGDITEQMINDERLIEMFGENDRIDYLRGLKVDIPKGERGMQPIDPNGGPEPDERPNEFTTEPDPYTSENFVWAIPIEEYHYNESLKKKTP